VERVNTYVWFSEISNKKSNNKIISSDPWGRAGFDPCEMIYVNFVEDRKGMLQAKFLDIYVSNAASQSHNILSFGLIGTRKSYIPCEIYNRMTGQGKKVKLTCSTG
jgi:hypothetical protein